MIFLTTYWRYVVFSILICALIASFSIYRYKLIKSGYDKCHIEMQKMQEDQFLKAQKEIKENEKIHYEGKKNITTIRSNESSGVAVNSAFDWLRQQKYYNE